MTTKNTKPAKPAAKKVGGLTRVNARSRVISLRKKGESWAAIAATLEVAPRTARRLFDEKNGEGAHFASRVPGKGGRTRAV